MTNTPQVMAVGRWRDDRAVERLEKCVRNGMRRHAHGHRVETGEREIGDTAIRLLCQH